MTQPVKDAVAICKTIVRNGYDAYLINSQLQLEAQRDKKEIELDIATDITLDELAKLFPQSGAGDERLVLAVMREAGVVYRFYPADTVDSSHPETALAKVTPHMLDRMAENGEVPLSLACPYMPNTHDHFDGFRNFDSGVIAFEGLPDETLKRDYLRGVRALRFSANYNLPIEPNSWMAIIRGVRRILDYVSVTDIMDEWRKVEAENHWRYLELLFESQILHGLIPEVAALSRIKIPKQSQEGQIESVLERIVNKMHAYPEEKTFDWYGTMACMFSGVGMLYTAEFFDGEWSFHRSPEIGAKVTRKILNRLRFLPQDTDLICHLVRYNRRFLYMLTDKGIRRFKALDEFERLIAMARAEIKATDGNYAAFNHNMRMMDRADMPEEMLEPLLNGREIMDFTNLKPGPAVGIIREALLQAQIRGDVTSVPEAVEFVRDYKEREKL